MDSSPRQRRSSEGSVRPWLAICAFFVLVLAIGSIVMQSSKGERSRHDREAAFDSIPTQESTGSPMDGLSSLSPKDRLPQTETAAKTSAVRAPAGPRAGNRANADHLVLILEELQKANEPFQFAKLAQRLEELAPGQFSNEIVLAARALLKAGNEFFDGRDVAPIFEVLQHYGGESVVLDLEQAAGNWQYYSAIALAQLPNGVGITTLIRMAQAQSSTTRQSAVLLIGQVSGQNQMARDFLMTQALQNGILSDSWIALAPLLRGDQLRYQNSAFDASVNALDLPESKIDYVAKGNQSVTTVPSSATLNSEELSERTYFLNRLLSVVSDPVATEALQSSLDLLASQTFWASFLSD
jgi:hypothetical protein